MLPPKDFDYGPLNRLVVFKDTHPSVMNDMIAKFDWADKLQMTGKPDPNRELHKHERLKLHIHTWIEQNLLKGNSLGGFNNYHLLKNI